MVIVRKLSLLPPSSVIIIVVIINLISIISICYYFYLFIYYQFNSLFPTHSLSPTPILSLPFPLTMGALYPLQYSCLSSYPSLYPEQNSHSFLMDTFHQGSFLTLDAHCCLGWHNKKVVRCNSILINPFREPSCVE